MSESEQGPSREKELTRFKALRDLPPFIVAALILAYALHGLEWDKVARAVGRADLPLFAAGALVFSIAHFLTTTVSYTLMYQWFLKRVSFSEMAKVFGATLLPQAIVPAVGQGIFYAYMVKKKRLKLLKVLGQSFFYIFCDLWVMALVIGAALALEPGLPLAVKGFLAALLAGVVAGAIYFPGGLGKKIAPRIYNSDAFHALREARPRHYAIFMASRLAFPLFQVAGHYIALRAMGMEPPPGPTIVIVTVMTLTSFLPVSALGLGAPNLAALYFAPYVAKGMDPAETAAAYGLLFQTMFLINRSLIGLVFAGPFWRAALRPGGEDGEDDPEEDGA